MTNAQTQAESVLAGLKQQATINPDPKAQDTKAPGYSSEQTSNKPAQPSKKELKSIIEGIDEAQRARRTANQNGMQFRGFLAKGPHRGKYTRDILGKDKLECVNEKSEFFGQMKPVKVPERANYQIDGLCIIGLDGKEIYIKQSKAIDWLLNETWGTITASEEGRAVYIHRPNTTDSQGRLRPLQLRFEGASRFNSADVIETYEPLVENGVPAVKMESIPLDTEKTYAKGETRENIRGKVEFPIFQRIDKYRNDLGEINTKENKTMKLTTDAAIEQATEDFALLFSHHTKEQGL